MKHANIMCLLIKILTPLFFLYLCKYSLLQGLDYIVLFYLLAFIGSLDDKYLSLKNIVNNLISL